MKKTRRAGLCEGGCFAEWFDDIRCAGCDGIGFSKNERVCAAHAALEHEIQRAIGEEMAIQTSGTAPKLNVKMRPKGGKKGGKRGC